MSHVLLVSSAFPPAQQSGAYRVEAFARYLPECDFDVSVLCAKQAGQNPYAVCDAAWQDDKRWLHVIRTDWQDTRYRTSVYRRLPMLATTAKKRSWREVSKRLLEAVRKEEVEGVDVILASGPPPQAIMAGVEIGKQLDAPVIADLRDPWVQFSEAPYRHLVDYWMERRVARDALRSCEKIITTTDASAELLSQDLGLSADCIRVIANGYDEYHFQEIDFCRPPETDEFIIAHAGSASIGRPVAAGRHLLKRMMGFDYYPLHRDPYSRSLDPFLVAIERLVDETGGEASPVRLQLVGMLPPEIEAVNSNYNLGAVACMLPQCTPREALGICARAHILLLLQYDTYRRGMPYPAAIPGKLYNYLRLNRPVLASMQRGEAAELIEELGAGSVSPPGDSEDLYAHLRSAFDAWASSSWRPPFEDIEPIRKFDRREQTRQLADLIKGVV